MFKQLSLFNADGTWNKQVLFSLLFTFIITVPFVVELYSK